MVLKPLKQLRYQIEGVMMHKVPAYKKGDITFPWRLLDSRETKYSFDYRYEVPSGYGIIDLERQIDALYAATGFIIELIDRAGHIDICVLTHDFPKLIPFDEVKELIRTDKILLGLSRRMTPIYHSFAVNPHLLIGGMPGYGKTDLLRFIMYQMLLMDYDIRVIDMKGYSFLPFAKIPNLKIARSLDTAIIMLEETVQELLNREEQVYTFGRKLIDSFKPIVVIVDEAAQMAPTLFNNGDRRDRTSNKYKAIQCMEYCSKIATKGRESKVSMIYCTQRPDSEVVHGQIKASMESSICFRTKTASNSEIILDRTGAEKLPEGVEGRSIYSGKNDVIIQIPFVGKDAQWEELLNPFYWKDGANGSHRKLQDKKTVETDDFGNVEDHTAHRNKASGSFATGASGESTKTGFRNVAGNGAKRTFNREPTPQDRRNQSLPLESGRTEVNGDNETTDTFEYE